METVIFDELEMIELLLFLQDPSNVTPVSKRVRNGKLSSCTTNTLDEWLLSHIDNPYPNGKEKRDLCAKTNLTIVQLNNWFSNARRRRLKGQSYNRPTTTHKSTSNRRRKRKKIEEKEEEWERKFRKAQADEKMRMGWKKRMVMVTTTQAMLNEVYV